MDINRLIDIGAPSMGCDGRIDDILCSLPPGYREAEKSNLECLLCAFVPLW